MSQRYFKFLKLMEHQAKLKLNKQRTPILDQSLLIGRVLPGRTPYELASGFNPSRLTRTETQVEIRVPYFVYDDHLKAFFQHEWDFLAMDTNNACKSGDTVLIERIPEARETSESLSLKEEAVKEFWKPLPENKKALGLTHKVLEIIYQLGDVQDPLTNKPVVIDRYRDQIAATNKLYGLTDSDFDYDKAPPRGRLEGTRDFTDRRTYAKWHKFQKNDKYGVSWEKNFVL